MLIFSTLNKYLTKKNCAAVSLVARIFLSLFFFSFFSDKYLRQLYTIYKGTSFLYMFKSTNSEIKVFKKDDFEHNKSKVFLFIKNLKKIYVCVLYEIY